MSKSAWNDNLQAIPYYQTVFFEAERDDGYMAYALGYVDLDGGFMMTFDEDDAPDNDPDRWHVLRWLDPTRV